MGLTGMMILRKLFPGLSLMLLCLLHSGPLRADTVGASGIGSSELEESAGDDFDLSLDDLDGEPVEEVPAAEVKIVTAEELAQRVELQAPKVLGFHKGELLIVLGVVTWCLLLLAILTRVAKISGRARLLLRLHKVFAYSGIVLATVHGVIALFF
jgi:hypothetical protein